MQNFSKIQHAAGFIQFIWLFVNYCFLSKYLLTEKKPISFKKTLNL